MTDFPLRSGTAEQFDALRSFLDHSAFREETLLARYEVRHLDALIAGHEYLAAEDPAPQPDDALTLLVRLFLRGDRLPSRDVERHVPTDVRAILDALGLIITAPGHPGCVEAPIQLYPCGPVWLASDRFLSPDRAPYHTDRRDFVMLGISRVSREFVSALPRTPCRRLLDLGTGAGNGGLPAASCAGHVWASDINRRAAAFTEFNRLLNGIGNVKVLEGDLFEPVAGLTFDRIVSHPPFEPPLKDDYVYSIGGHDGEQIMRRVVEALPDHLEPGGRLYLFGIGADRQDESFEERIRGWLGPQSAEFDVALFIREILTPARYATESVVAGHGGLNDVARWVAFFRNLGTRELLYGHAVLQRRAAPRPVFTLRRLAGAGTQPSDIEWLLEWETRAADPAFESAILESRPRFRPETEVTVRDVYRARELAPVEYKLRARRPFETDLTCHPWVVMLASLCHGDETARQLRDSMLSRRAIPLENREVHFFQALRTLVSSGCVELTGFAPHLTTTPPPA